MFFFLVSSRTVSGVVGMKLFKPIDSAWRALQNIFWSRHDRSKNLSANRPKSSCANLDF